MPAKLAKGLDVRANGGYVVIPGSRHYTGHLYAWFQDWHPNDHDPGAMPGVAASVLGRAET